MLSWHSSSCGRSYTCRNSTDGVGLKFVVHVVAVVDVDVGGVVVVVCFVGTIWMVLVSVDLS